MTTLDFPGVVSALLFTQGCNFHCSYCHNADLIPMRSEQAQGRSSAEARDEAAMLAFLRDRRDVLDGVVISGGEPCLQPNLEMFCSVVKALGYKIKLDTNGYFPGVVQRLVAANLVDYVAVDVKTAPDDYAMGICRHANAGTSLAKTLSFLAAANVRHEARTTCVAPFVSPPKLQAMSALVNEGVPWFLQRANIDERMSAMGLRALDEKEMHSLLAAVQPTRPLLSIR